MKKLVVISILISVFMTQTKAQAQTSDLQLIEETLNLYFDGLANHNAKSLEKAFHPTATMKWIGDQYTSVNAVDALVASIQSGPKEKINTTIISINIAGNAASAYLELEFKTFSYFDFMQLLKIDGEWKIVSKIYSEKLKSFER